MHLLKKRLTFNLCELEVRLPKLGIHENRIGGRFREICGFLDFGRNKLIIITKTLPIKKFLLKFYFINSKFSIINNNLL
jgi:hypothetical protein